MNFSPGIIHTSVQSEFNGFMITMLRMQYDSVKARFPLSYSAKLQVVWEAMALIMKQYEVTALKAVELLLAQQTDEQLCTLKECHAAIYLFDGAIKKTAEVHRSAAVYFG